MRRWVYFIRREDGEGERHGRTGKGIKHQIGMIAERQKSARAERPKDILDAGKKQHLRGPQRGYQEAPREDRLLQI